eukprot:Seg1701.7 transcript_id=Seg1701.7/GoldUCD/mRNA.D3Y31 product="U6 snRNA-associated Sm-like protein LSm8" protein_id=Seg1701.7/GoldUCD/D3Y31
MATSLESYMGRMVSIITQDGRMIVGTLKGFDQTVNLILDESHERVFSSSTGVEQVVLGLYIVRGDNVAIIGEIDDEVDSGLDFANVKAEPLNPVLKYLCFYVLIFPVHAAWIEGYFYTFLYARFNRVALKLLSLLCTFENSTKCSTISFDSSPYMFRFVLLTFVTRTMLFHISHLPMHI